MSCPPGRTGRREATIVPGGVTAAAGVGVGGCYARRWYPPRALVSVKLTARVHFDEGVALLQRLWPAMLVMAHACSCWLVSEHA